MSLTLGENVLRENYYGVNNCLDTATHDTLKQLFTWFSLGCTFCSAASGGCSVQSAESDWQQLQMSKTQIKYKKRSKGWTKCLY